MLASQSCVDLVKVTITTEFRTARAVYVQKSKLDSLLPHLPAFIFFLSLFQGILLALEEWGIDEI